MQGSGAIDISSQVRMLHATIDRLQEQIAMMTIRQQQQEKAMEYLARIIDRMRENQGVAKA